jgi:hypothetical protein
MSQEIPPIPEDKPVDSNQVIVNAEEAGIGGALENEADNPYADMDRQLAECAQDTIEPPKPPPPKPKTVEKFNMAIDWFSFLFSTAYVIMGVKK